MQIKTNIVSCHTADSKPVKQEVNSTVILPPLVFPGERERKRGRERESEKELRVRECFMLARVPKP